MRTANQNGAEPMNANDKTKSCGPNSENQTEWSCNDFTVVDRFETIVSIYAERNALNCDNRTLSYDELNRWVNRIAHRVIHSCRSNNTLDGDLPDRVISLANLGPDKVAANLAVLKSGKTLIPLNPNSSSQRLSKIISDSEPSAILTCSQMTSRAKQLSNGCCPIIDVSRDSVALPENNPGLSISPRSVSYIAFTSGSTGSPKGVIHTHSSLVESIKVWHDIIPIVPSDHCVMFTQGTGSALKILLSSCLFGATLFAKDIQTQGFTNPADWIRRNRISVLTIPPQLYRTLIAELSHDDHFPDVRILRLNSDSVFPSDLTEACRHFGPNCTFINALSTTETGMVSAHSVQLKNVEENCDVSLGYPVKGTDIFIMNGDDAPFQRKGSGILGITGNQVALGYWNDPELTEKHFFSSPADPQKRSFRTSDVVHINDDGQLSMLGRSNNQIKVRSNFVNLCEVEGCLLQHPNVKKSALKVDRDNEQGARIIAFVQVDNVDMDNRADIMSFLDGRIESYMLPADIVTIQEMPLLPNGKIDVDKLALPALDTTNASANILQATNDIEREVLTVWSEILDNKAIRLEDDFFYLGGNSLLAIRMMIQLGQRLMVHVPMHLLSEASTVEHFAAELSKIENVSPPKPVRGTAANSSYQGSYPLSFPQQRLWFIAQLEEQVAAYNMSSTYEFEGELDKEDLRRAVERIVHRHEPLRTVVNQGDDGRIYQSVLPKSPFKLSFCDLTSHSEAEQATKVAEHQQSQERTVFDLSSDLMLRAILIKLNADHHLLLLTIHHIATDGWSHRILQRELSYFYTAEHAGEELPLTDLDVHYKDFAIWQQNSAPRHSSQLDYWLTQLSNLPDLDLPTDQPRPNIQTHRGGSTPIRVTMPLAQQLQNKAAESHATTHMLLMAVFQVLLQRYAGQDDFGILVPIAGRNDPDLAYQIGCFINVLVIRADLSGNPSFDELVSRVRDTSLGAYSQQEIPYDQIVENTCAQRDLSRNPLAQVLFQYSDTDPNELNFPNLNVKRHPSLGLNARFDLELNLVANETGIAGELVYNTDLFQAATIDRLTGHFYQLLESIAKDTSQPIANLQMLSAPEQQQVLFDCNQTSVNFPSENSVHQLFEEQVQRTPDSIAVEFEEQKLTYQELNQRANQLAHDLRHRGVQTGDSVGLCLERSPEAIISILGILKAGAAYVPLDPDYPSQRLDFMIRDANLAFIVTKREFSKLLSTDITAVYLDTDVSATNEQFCDAPLIHLTQESPAYVMFTSGSTGRPKGVVMPHRALRNLVQWQMNQEWMGPARTLQFASCNFDVSFQELMTTLGSGGALILISELTRRDPVELWKLINQAKIERLFLPFVMLQQLATVGTQGGTTLREIISAGESLQLSPEIRQLFQRLEGCRLHNHYGPTESHVVTSHVLDCDIDNWPNEAPIGKPIANTQIYLLDQQQQPVPIGVSGELYIGGECLANGYLNQPELTAERFISNPYSNEPDSRLYRTGDLCRRLPGGTLEFMGRCDDQIKLRGFRVELGEIESALLAHPDVAQAVVVVRDNQADDQRLIAYCVPHESTTLEISSIKRELKDLLPDYMLPSAFVELETFPLTNTGKLDRRALPVPDDSRPELDVGYVAATTEQQKQLVEIWQELLKLEQIGIHDNFFELGGHSLLAMRLLAIVDRRLSITYSLKDFFQNPTIDGLIQTSDKPIAVAPELLSIHQPAKRDSNATPLVVAPNLFGHINEWISFFSEFQLDRPVYGLQLAGHAPYWTENPSIEEIATRMIDALDDRIMEQPIHFLGHSFGAYLAYEMAQQLERRGKKPASVILIDARPFTQHPSWRFRDFLSIASNAPFWLVNELRVYGAGDLMQRFQRRLKSKRTSSDATDNPASSLEQYAVRAMQQMFNLSDFSSLYQDRLVQSYLAFIAYQMQPTNNHVIYLKSRVRNLIHRHSHNGNWDNLVNPGSLDVFTIPGDHGEPLHDLWQNEFFRILQKALKKIDQVDG